MFGNIASAAEGKRYFVDATSGSDSNSGLTSALAWKTVDKVNDATFAAGNKVLFKRGETWRETLTVPSSGSAGKPIVFGAYSTGAKPLISGAAVLADFEQSAGSWQAIWTSPGLSDSTSAAANQYRVYLPAADISGTASTIRVKLKAHSTGDIAIDGMSIGPKKSSSDAFDYSSAPTRITFDSGNNGVTVGAGTDKYSDPITFSVAESNDYLVHIATSAAHNRTWAAYATGIWYKASSTDDTATADVSSYSAWSFTVILAAVERQIAAATWQKSGVTTEPTIVTYDGTRLQRDSGATTGCSLNKWDWASNVLYINVGEDPSNGVVEVASLDYCIVQQKSYITLSDLDTRMSKGAAGVFNWTNAGATAGITIRGCTARQHVSSGIAVLNGHASATTDNVSITDNECYENGTSGINFGSTNNVLVARNIVHHNTWHATDYHAGIHVWGQEANCSGVVIEDNIVYGNYFSGNLWSKGNGIHVDEVAGSPGPIVRRNIVYDNEQIGIFVEHVRSGAKVYNNLCYGNGPSNLLSAGVFIYRGCLDAEVYNNTCYGNNVGLQAIGENSGDEYTDCLFKNNIATGNSSKELWVQGGADNAGGRGSGNVYSHNCFGAEATAFIRWGADTDFATYDAWISASSQGDNNAEAEPSFTDAADADFTLQSDSPCINAGTDVGLTTDFAGNPLVGTPDIGAYEYQS
jgi:hypothetical protein